MQTNACAHVIENLRRRFPSVPESTVIATVEEIAATFRDARILDYIPLLVEREARDVLSRRRWAITPALERAS